jgi:predicted RNase H-like HicB family nuclease
MSDKVADTLHITIEYFTGKEEGEDDVGYPYYVASTDEIAAVTQGRTWNELLRNIHEMLEAALDEQDTVEMYSLVPNPRIVITMELPENYAEIA